MGEHVTLDKTFDSLLLVTGQIRDIGQNVLLSYFQTGSSSSSQLLAHFLPYRNPPGGLYYKSNNYTVH